MSLCTIVGMGPGIGLSVATIFASKGFDIAMVARSRERLDTYESFFRTEGRKALGYEADAAQFDLLKFAFTQIQAEFGSTEVLIYNAALVRKTAVGKLNPETLVQDFTINVVGAMYSTQLVLPQMEQQGRGTVLFTGGGFAHQPSPDHHSLSAGKAALLNYSLNLAQQYGAKGIHVATVSIFGKVTPGTRYDPDLIAEKYWELHTQPKESWETEVRVR